MRSHLLALLLVALLALSFGVGHVPSSMPNSARISPAVSIDGAWVISSVVSEANQTITVAGNVTIQTGGVLDLTNVDLQIVENAPLAFGLTIQPGGSLIAHNMTFGPLDPQYPAWIWSQFGSRLQYQGGTIEYVGGSSRSVPGLFLQASGAVISDVTFDHYYEAILVSNAANVSLTGLSVLDSSTAPNTTAAVYVSSGCPGFALTHSVFKIPQNIYALRVASKDARVANNTFRVDPNGTQLAAVEFAALSDGTQNAAGSEFAHNTLVGTGFIDEAGSYVTILDNVIQHTGPNRPYGIMVETPLWARAGMWTSHVWIENNYISDYSRYGIRLQQNVSHFAISGNVILNPSQDPGPAWTEVYGGPQIDGIYLIRDIISGTVNHNLVDVSDLPSIACDGMTMEAKTSDVTVTDNRFLNVSQVGIVLQGDVPGFDGAYPWQVGPSLHNYIGNNLFENDRYVAQTNFLVDGILLWLWANYTTVANNTFVGWQNVDTASPYNGAIVYTSSSFGNFTNNTIDGARYGFVFRYWGYLSGASQGEFNRSWNQVYGNRVSNLTVAAVKETPSDGMGPIHNIINYLASAAGNGSIPASQLESVGPIDSVSVAAANGSYAETLTLPNPFGPGVESLSTSVAWAGPPFALELTGGFSAAQTALTISRVAPGAVSYRTEIDKGQTDQLNFSPTHGSYWAIYEVNLTNGSSTSSMQINSTVGALTFPLGGISSESVSVSLLSWGSVTPPSGPENQSGNSSGNLSVGNEWRIVGTLQAVQGELDQDLTVLLTFTLNNASVITLETAASLQGEFVFDDLTFSGNLTGVALAPANFTVDRYSFVELNSTDWRLSITVTNNGTQSTTAPGPTPLPPSTTGDAVTGGPSLSLVTVAMITTALLGCALSSSMLGIELRKIVRRSGRRSRPR